MPKLKLMERRIQRVGVSNSGTKRLRQPVTPSILRQVKALWAPTGTDFDTEQCVVLCLLASSELLEVTTSSCMAVVVEDVAVEQPRTVSVFLMRSKNRPICYWGATLFKSNQSGSMPSGCYAILSCSERAIKWSPLQMSEWIPIDKARICWEVQTGSEIVMQDTALGLGLRQLLMQQEWKTQHQATGALGK